MTIESQAAPRPSLHVADTVAQAAHGAADAVAHAAHDVAHAAHDAAESRYGWLYALVALFVAGMALAVKTWGLVALGLTAVAFVPVMMLILIAITLGK